MYNVYNGKLTIKWLPLKLSVLFDCDWQTSQLTFNCKFVWLYRYFYAASASGNLWAILEMFGAASLYI